MGKKIYSSIKLATKLYSGNWKYLFLTMLTGGSIFFLRPLIAPLFLNRIYSCINNRQFEELLYLSMAAIIMIVLLLVVSYFLIVYADVWAIFLVTKGCISSYQYLYEIPMQDLGKKFNHEEQFNRIVEGSDAPSSIIAIIVQCLSMLASLIIILHLLYQISPLVLIFAVFIMMLECLRVKFELNRNYNYHSQAQKENAKLNGSVHTVVHNVEQLLFLDETTTLIEEFEAYQREYWKYKFLSTHTRLICNLFSELSFSCFKAIILGVMHGLSSRSIGLLGSINNLLESFRDTTRTTIQYASELPDYIAKADRIEELLGALEGHTSIHEENQGIDDVVKVNNAVVCYGSKVILNHVSFTIKKGDKVAIIGENGSGKSTCIQAILGNCKLNSGSIITCGIRATLLTHEQKEKRIGYIPVNPQLYDISPLENIGLGTDRDEIYLPFSGELFIDKENKFISSGQMRRINIIRGIQKRPEILIADEPDSELDEDLSDRYMDEIINSAQTVLVITHNKKLLHKFDYLLVCENGVIYKKL